MKPILSEVVTLPSDVRPERCITCSDEGVIGRVVSLGTEPFAPAVVRFEDGDAEVDLTLVPDAGPGDFVLVHAGGALAVVDPTDEQREVLR